MRIQLWSYNYEPEPQGVAPLSTALAAGLRDRGHDILVVAAHPHYPEPVWGKRRRPYREHRDGIAVLRLPLWIGRAGALERVRQEFSFALAQALATPLLPDCDVVVAVSPSFPAQAPAIAFSRLRRAPLVIWLQDIVTDAAVSTGLLPRGPLLAAALRFERLTYASAARIVVVSEAFRRNLRAKGVADEKIVRGFNPITLPPAVGNPRADRGAAEPRILVMGNIGYSQGLDRIVEAFEASTELTRQHARLIICGHGVEAEAVAARIRTDRVEMLGLIPSAAVEAELCRARLGLVSQRADVAEFNLPSKLMNYMAYGLPVLASVPPDSETATIVREAGAGWVADTRDTAAFARTAATAIADSNALRARGDAGRAYADAHFRPEVVAREFEAVLESVVPGRSADSRATG